MDRIASSDRCENEGCHRRATWETKHGIELCSTCARMTDEWKDAPQGGGAEEADPND